MSRINGFIGRRDLLRGLGIAGVGVAGTAIGSQLLQPAPADAETPSSSNNPKPAPVSPDQALQRLIEGNKRFVQQQAQHPNQTLVRLESVAAAQYPFAALLSCSDSRVPVEIVFDQGVGDLFPVRLAGNVAGPEAVGSLEFSTAVLGAQLIVVLGHESCGAVKAAIAGAALPGYIGAFVEPIKPGLINANIAFTDKPDSATVDQAVVANVRYQVQMLKQSSTILSQRVKAGQLKIVGGRYDLNTGAVTIVA